MEDRDIPDSETHPQKSPANKKSTEKDTAETPTKDDKDEATPSTME